MLNALRKIVQEVNAAANLSDALRVIVKRVQAEMLTQVCSIYLRDAASERYVLMATEGLHPEAVSRVSLAYGEGLIGLVASRKEPINLDEADAHPQYRYFPETGEERFRSFLGSPIIHHGKVLGVIVVQQAEERRFDEAEESFIVTLAAQLAAVIAHAEASGSLMQQATAGYTPAANTFVGVPSAPGVAIGRVAVIYQQSDLSGVPMIETDNVQAELERFNNALVRVRFDLQDLSQQLEHRLGEEERALFDVYLGMLTNQALGGEISNKIINEHLEARSAVAAVILEHVNTFESMEDSYLRERAADVRDLGLRVLTTLERQQQTKREYPKNTILVSEELTASMLGEVPEDCLVGMISIRGSNSSHVAILARAMGIPTVMGAAELPYRKLDGREVILDAYRGRIYTNPSDELRHQFTELWREEQQFSREYHALTPLPSETLDGVKMPLWVNTGLMTDVVRSLDRGAEGVGLYRTEISFLLKDRFPSEEEQRATYREQLAAFAPRPVTMRTLDIGGDKALPYFPIEEDNPFLGWRGIRVSLDHPEIFLVQVRAMLKASIGLNNLRVMLPMISGPSELIQATSLIDLAIDELRDEGHDVERPEIGAMLEVPAVLYQLPDIMNLVDFVSVGTNDLIQYLMAVDRNNSRVAGLYSSFHPAVLRALTDIVRAAKAHDVSVSVCGEMAGDPSAAVLLMAMGVDVLSMNANTLPKVKSVVRALHLSDMQQLLTEVLPMHDSKQIIKHITARLIELGIKPRLLHTKDDD